TASPGAPHARAAPPPPPAPGAGGRLLPPAPLPSRNPRRPLARGRVTPAGPSVLSGSPFPRGHLRVYRTTSRPPACPRRHRGPPPAAHRLRLRFRIHRRRQDVPGRGGRREAVRRPGADRLLPQPHAR